MIQNTKQFIAVGTLLLLERSSILMDCNYFPSSWSKKLRLTYFLRILYFEIRLPFGLTSSCSHHQANHRRLGLSFEQSHHQMHNQEANSGHQDGVSQNPHHPKNPTSHPPGMVLIIILSSMNASNGCLHFSHFWRKFGSLSTHVLLQFLPATLSTPNPKDFRAYSTCQLLEYLCVSREITVQEMRCRFSISSSHPHVFFVISCVIAKFSFL